MSTSMNRRKGQNKNDQNNEDNNDGEKEEEVEENENDFDQFEAALANKGLNAWSTGGVRKDVAIRTLIQCFGSMIESFPSPDSIPDHKGRYRSEDMVHQKLLDAPKQVLKAKRILLENENFDTREFTIFISRKKWVANILRPLLELCAKEDTALAMNCCSLVLVLCKKISDATSKKLKTILKAKKKTKQTAEDLGSDSEVEDKSLVVENVKQQLIALLSFKEALCSEKCNEAIINAFKHYWLIEQEVIRQGMHLQEVNRQTKLNVAICLSYFRRILSIEPHSEWSSANEILTHRSTHNKYIIQLRIVLSLIPGIVSDLGVKDKSRYHDDWLIDIILILFHVVQSFDPKDLFTVWKSKSLMANFERSDVVVSKQLSQATKHQIMSSKGSLSESLSFERQARNNKQIQCNRFSKFTSTYRIPVKPIYDAGNELPRSLGSSVNAPSTANNVVAPGKGLPAGNAPKTQTVGGADAKSTAMEENLGRVINSSAIIVKNPFQNGAESIPQAKTKRNKKNITYAKENSAIDHSVTQSKITNESQQACVVVASLVERLTDEACLKSLIRRVNEDLRRDEMRISPDMELNYFLIVANLLQYNRLKIEQEYQQFLQDRKKDPLLIWEPNLRNIMDILDKMSFTRVTVALDRCTKNEALHDRVWIPMTLYLEMICYLQLLLQSEIEGHHEIAIGALYRLFYTTTEKLDPLFKLFNAWKPSLYPKKHLHLLIRISRQTMLTLEAAKNLFINQGITTEEAFQISQAKKRKQQRGKDNTAVKHEMDMEQYLLSSLRFNTDEYFRRFVNHRNIDIFLRILSDMEKNESSIHECIADFLDRLQQFKLENPYETTNGGPDYDTDPASIASMQAVLAIEKEVNLTYLLFNLQSFIVIELILNHPQLQHYMKFDIWLCKIVGILRKIVRRFGELASKNHLMFVEILFTPARAQEHCLQLENVYDAMLYTRREILSGLSPHDDNQIRNSEKSAPWDKEEDARTSSSSSDSDVEEEVDFDALALEKREEEKERQERKEEKRKEKERQRSEKEKRRGEREKGPEHREWSAEEDELLRRLYKQYVGSADIFQKIKSGFPKHRDEGQIQARVLRLQLHLHVHDDDDDEEEEEEVEAEGLGGNLETDRTEASSSRAVEEELLATPATQPQVWSASSSSAVASANNLANSALSAKSYDSALDTTKESLFASAHKPSTRMKDVFWEVNEEDLKQFEERALGLPLSDQEGRTQDIEGRERKRSLKRGKAQSQKSTKRQRAMNAASSNRNDEDEDDHVFSDVDFRDNDVIEAAKTIKRNLLDSDDDE